MNSDDTSMNTPSAEERVPDVFKSQAPLSEQHVAAYAPLLLTEGRHKDVVQGAYVGGNSSVAGSQAFPTGQVIHYYPWAKVDPRTLRPDTFQYAALCRILPAPGQTLTDADFLTEESRQKLAAAVPQFTPYPIDMDVRGPNNRDTDHWMPELGDNGACGIVKRRRGPRAHDYFVVAQCGAPVYGSQYIDSLAAPDAPAMNWFQFSKDPRTIYWRNAARRSARRIAHRVAEALSVRIETEQEGLVAFTESDDQALPVSARPTHEQAISAVLPSFFDGFQVISHFDHCAPAISSRAAYHLVAASPFEGYVGVHLQAGFHPSRGAVPTTTGRRHPAPVDKPIHPEDAAIIQKHYVDERSTTDNARLHPETYRRCDDAFIKAEFIDQGWQAGMSRDIIEPVLLKVAHADVQRP